MKTALQVVYDNFLTDLDIDPNTGILGFISNPRYQNILGTLRFSGYPFIGSQYKTSSPKILVVGQDIGLDERMEENTYHSFDTRNKLIEPREQSENYYNKHLCGTYGVVLFLLKEFYGWTKYWDNYFKNRNETFETIVRKYGPTILPYDVFSHVAFTNLHKFVTIGRKERRSGVVNRKWYNPIQEKQLFKSEVDVLSPDIVYIQGQSDFDWQLLDYLKQSRYRLVLSDHPSSWRNGANKPTYVEKLNYINW